MVPASVGGPTECGKEITALRKALDSICFCNKEKPHLEVAACIRLNSSIRDDCGVTFGVLFKAHPHQDARTPEEQPWWQDTDISVRGRVLVTRLRFPIYK